MKEKVGGLTLDWLVCISKACSQGSPLLLAQGGAVSPRLRPQMSEHQSENKKICQYRLC